MWIGLDVGDVRVGVARCDPAGVLAVPVETVRRAPGDLDRLAVIAREHGAVEVVIGLPRSLSGREGPAADKARQFAGQLAAAVAPVPVRLVDVLLSTVAADRALRYQGRNGRQRRAVVD